MKLKHQVYALRARELAAQGRARNAKQPGARPPSSFLKTALFAAIAFFSVATLLCSAPTAAGATGQTIKNTSSGLCIDTGGATGFSALTIAKCSGAASQNFTLVSSPLSGYSYVESSSSALCWDVEGGSASSGAGIQQYTCTAVKPEYFELSQVSSGNYEILVASMSKGCITVSGSSIVQATCSGASSQIFQVGTTMAVTVSPTSASVASAGGQQFTATVTGSTNTAVTWTASSGSITTGGMFTAPSVTSNTSVTVKATSQANPSMSASATVTVAPATHTLTVSSSSLSFGNVSVGNTVTSGITLTNGGNTSVTISSVSVSGTGFSDSGIVNGTILTAGQTATLAVAFDPKAAGTVTGSISIASNATNSPATISLSGDGVTNSVNVQSYGATGNGSTDDTAAIKKAIAALTPGATLLFPCGTYLTSSVLYIDVTNVTVNGSSCATIHNNSSGTIMIIGGSGNANPNYGSAVALSSTANELSTSFTTGSSLGVSAGGYVLLQQGGEDSSQGSGNTGCDTSGCRGEVVQVASVSGNTYTVTTALHDTYNPSVNAATAQAMTGVLTGMTLENITLNGSGSNVYGLSLAGVANSTVSGVTVENVQGAALLNRGGFNDAWSNISITGAGSEDCGAAVWFQAQGNLAVNALTIANENTASNNCLGDGAFGFEMVQSANGILTNVMVNGAKATGRPFKITAARHNTFNSLTVENGAAAFNGASLEYYSSYNTFNTCVVTNNGAGTGTGTGNAGINTFGNFNQYNTFSNCTVTGNGNVQVLVNNYDDLRLAQDTGNTFNGGTYTGSTTSEPVFDINGASTYVTGAKVGGPGAYGIYINDTGACVNGNVMTAGTSLSTGIYSSSSSNIGANNVMNGMSSNLTAGTCTGP